MEQADQIYNTLKTLSTPERAIVMSRFFKTGIGQYGEGDIFMGVSAADYKRVVKNFWKQVSFSDIQILLESPLHEMRTVGLLILVEQFEKSKGDQSLKDKIAAFYLSNTQYVNNWDLVDLTCYKILGKYCYDNERDDILIKLSESDDLWEKRIAVVSTIFYVKQGAFNLTKELVIKNMRDSHDLMHKANGWLLREIGKKNKEELTVFLRRYYHDLPRTTLRYAIERHDEATRKRILKGEFS